MTKTKNEFIKMLLTVWQRLHLHSHSRILTVLVLDLIILEIHLQHGMLDCIKFLANKKLINLDDEKIILNKLNKLIFITIKLNNQI